MKTCIHSTRIIAASGLTSGYLLVKDGKIQDICSDAPPCDVFLEAGDFFVSPGFIDIHLHGGGGFDFMDGTVEAVLGAAEAHLLHGTTALLPTTLTCSEEELRRFFSCYHAALKTCVAPNLLGIHMEGPFLNAAQKGAQDEKYLRIPEPAYVQGLLAESPHIKRVTAAPEVPNAMALGDMLSSHGILMSIGHSDADYSCVKEALRHGYSHVTHLYSGMSQLHREGPYRVLGVVESTYLEDGLSAEIIADGIHLPEDLLRFILRFKAPEKLCLITDAMRGAGLPEGTVVKLGSLEKGQDVVIKNGVAMMMDGKAFAGSVSTADRCVRTVYNLGVLDICQTVKLMTYNPAKLLHIEDRKGSIKKGLDADLCIFDESIEIKAVLVNGQIRVNKIALEKNGKQEEAII